MYRHFLIIIAGGGQREDQGDCAVEQTENNKGWKTKQKLERIVFANWYFCVLDFYALFNSLSMPYQHHVTLTTRKIDSKFDAYKWKSQGLLFSSSWEWTMPWCLSCLFLSLVDLIQQPATWWDKSKMQSQNIISNKGNNHRLKGEFLQRAQNFRLLKVRPYLTRWWRWGVRPW